jgi:5-methylcytosine-specific restriction endonuclease McrA
MAAHLAVSTGRNTATRDRDRRTIARTKPPCGICEQPIDYTLKSPDPASFEVDHIIALHNGGLDVLENKQASHRKCNRDKWHRLAEQAGPRTYVTHRNWWTTT